MTTLRINLLMMVDTSGEVVYSKSVDLQTGEATTLPAQSRLDLLTSDVLYAFESEVEATQGLVVLPEGPMLVSARPVLTSNNEGPINAALIMGRYMDNQMIAEMEDITGVSLATYTTDDEAAPADVQDATAALGGDVPVIVQPLGGGTIGGYALLDDVEGDPALVVRMAMPREVFAQGTATVWYLLGALVLAGVTFAFVVVTLFEKALLSRLRILGAQVANIARDNDPAARISLGGRR